MKVKKGGTICELKSRKEADSSIGCCLGKKAPYPKMVEVSNTYVNAQYSSHGQ